MLKPGEKRKYKTGSGPYAKRQKKQPLENKLKDSDDRKPVYRPRTRQDNGKQFLTNLLYMTKLGDAMKQLIPFYWNPGKTIIDVTAGKKLIWQNFLYNHKFGDVIPWTVEFNDIDTEKDADYHVAAQEIHTLGKRWDILVCDFPFTDLKNGVESFGVRAKRHDGSSAGSVERAMKRSRSFYFDGYRPLKELFPECVEPFNKAADNLIVKMGDSHKGKRLISNCTEAELCFDNARNPKSEFQLVDRIRYRGNYARRGGRFPFAQSVVSEYLIFKKDVNSR